MSDSHSFTDVSAGTPRKQHFWPTLIVPRAAIEAEIERLASIDRPASGRCSRSPTRRTPARCRPSRPASTSPSRC